MNAIRLWTVIASFELVLLISLRAFSTGVVTISDMQVFALGNRTIMVKPLEQFELILGEENVRQQLGMNESYILAMRHRERSGYYILADYFGAGELTTYDDLLSSLQADSSVTIDRHYVGSSFLSVVFRYRNDNDQLHYYNRYIQCYPYYLRLRASWKRYERVPSDLEDAMNSIKVM